MSTDQSRFYYIVTFLTLALGLGASTSGALAAETKTESKQQEINGVPHGNWRIKCSDELGCRAAQSIVLEKSRVPIVVARVFRGDRPFVMLTLPSGIYLAPGLSVRVDTGKVRRFAYETCNEKGCHSGLGLDKKFLRDLKRGNTASVQFFDARQKPVLVSLSLKGFTNAYKALAQ